MHVNIAVVSCQGLLPMFYGQRVHKSRGLKQLNDGFCMDLRSLDWWISAGCWNFCQWTSQSTTSWHGKLHKGGTWPKLAVGRFLDARPLAFLGRRLFALAVVPEIVKQEMIFRYIYIICVCVCVLFSERSASLLQELPWDQASDVPHSDDVVLDDADGWKNSEHWLSSDGSTMSHCLEGSRLQVVGRFGSSKMTCVEHLAVHPVQTWMFQALNMLQTTACLLSDGSS